MPSDLKDSTKIISFFEKKYFLFFLIFFNKSFKSLVIFFDEPSSFKIINQF